MLNDNSSTTLAEDLKNLSVVKALTMKDDDDRITERSPIIAMISQSWISPSATRLASLFPFPCSFQQTKAFFAALTTGSLVGYSFTFLL